MTRQEFLDELREALQGEVDQRQINEHLAYYESYIMEESRKGKSESQVIEELGSPRLIAKTLIDTNDGYAPQASHESDSETYGDERDTSSSYGKAYRVNSKWILWGIIAAVILILVLLVSLFVYLAPILLPLVLILFLISIIFGRRQ